ncbi:MAG TPA: response regulator transcription factor [Myxococcales bacterium LLY-WYZ-16_1]|jgi:DNA-binding response OmpR family regulator|nr:response regulator transcription factor [Myxococcales bacterium LLY-WYZ-16_1]
MTAGTGQTEVLVVDDDPRLGQLLDEYLSSRGFAVRVASTGAEGLAALAGAPVDLVILDLGLPDLDGLEVCRRIGAAHDVPILMLTARGEATDRIVGLELGADDYLPKPFDPRELVARLHAILRRARGPAEPEPANRPVTAGPIAVDPERRRATFDGRELDLTSTEFDLLRALVAQAGRVLSRDRLMELARGQDFGAFDRSVDVHVSHLRRKLGDDPKRPRWIKTIRGVGYMVPRP